MVYLVCLTITFPSSFWILCTILLSLRYDFANPKSKSYFTVSPNFFYSFYCAVLFTSFAFFLLIHTLFLFLVFYAVTIFSVPSLSLWLHTSLTTSEVWRFLLPPIIFVLSVSSATFFVFCCRIVQSSSIPSPRSSFFSIRALYFSFVSSSFSDSIFYIFFHFNLLLFHVIMLKSSIKSPWLEFSE